MRVEVKIPSGYRIVKKYDLIKRTDLWMESEHGIPLDWVKVSDFVGELSREKKYDPIIRKIRKKK